MPANAVPAHERSRLAWFLEHFFWPGRNPEASAGSSKKPEEQREIFLHSLEKSGFNWIVFIVAASGFFTDSYNLFASNVILPALGYVYWADDSNHNKALAFNLATLAASAVGQFVFGVFADIGGRRSLYGIELIIVIVSTVGLLQSSPGFSDGQNSTWDVTAWIIFWRTIMGLGIGAEYPLSACIASEWSSTKSRGRMMAAVFAMQPLGQLCAYGAGLTALRVFGTSKVEIDKLFRYVIGIGAFPTLLALGFRLHMPESGRYFYDVRRSAIANDTKANGPTTPKTLVHDSSWDNFRFSELWRHIWHEGHWFYLLGTSACWFLLDFAFYGMGFNNPSTLAKLWTGQNLNFVAGAPWWMTSSSAINATIDGVEVVNGAFVFANGTTEIADPLIHNVLENNMLHAIYTVSIASILGSILMIALINRFDRKHMLTITFVIIGILLIIVAASFSALFHHDPLYIVLIMFWGLMSFLFSFGPNTLTFIIPAEVFPTKYRCSFYGIAAASGKIGALLVQIIILKVKRIGKPNSSAIRWLLLGFAFCMLLGGAISHYTLPQVQRRAERPASGFVNVPLEELPPVSRYVRKKNQVGDIPLVDKGPEQVQEHVKGDT